MSAYMYMPKMSTMAYGSIKRKKERKKEKKERKRKKDTSPLLYMICVKKEGKKRKKEKERKIRLLYYI